jgi:hypothetical protein
MTFTDFVLGFYNFYPLGVALAAIGVFIGQHANGYDAAWQSEEKK